jgi:hypothetical protein
MLETWDTALFPLNVTYAQTLRLRYQVCWVQEAGAFNRSTGVLVFHEPQMASSFIPAPGGILVKDSNDSKALDPKICLSWRDGKVVAATVSLPTNEKNSESCHEVVRQAIVGLFDANL